MWRKGLAKWLATIAAVALTVLLILGSPLTPAASFATRHARYDLVVQRGLMIVMKSTSASAIEEARGGRLRLREPGILPGWRSLLWWPHAWFITSPGFRQWCVPIWPAALLAGAFAAWLWSSNRRDRPGACAGCGYDLTGNVSGRCPECGGPVARLRP